MYACIGGNGGEFFAEVWVRESATYFSRPTTTASHFAN